MNLNRDLPADCWAVVPVKSLASAKSRLHPALDPAARRALSLAMLDDVLAALGATRGVAGTIVVSDDPAVHDLAQGSGALVVAEPRTAGVAGPLEATPAERLSLAVAAGADAARERGAARIVFVPADVPLVTPAALESLLGAPPAVHLVRAARDAGTNALCLPGLPRFGFDFGPGSAARHRAAATALGLELMEHEEPALALDIDLPADLEALAAAAPGGATGRWLAARDPVERGFGRPAAASPSLIEASLAGTLTRARADEAARLPRAELLAAAGAVRAARATPQVTFSPKVFIPLTHLCRDVCRYCTFAKTPRHLEAAYLAPEEVLAIAERGVAAGCTEALFTLGDRPETRYREAREALAALGYASTVDYLVAMARLVLEQTGLLPHINAGVLHEAEYRALRGVAPSMGLMLESASTRLMERGEAHFGSPDKHPAARLESIALAGRLKIPFTSGILIGIGETPAERLDALFALRALHERHGHLQELIVQNFVPKADTPMRGAPPAATVELLETVALARLVFGPAMSVQAPPNLNPLALEALLEAGINDFGGISPVTPDHVNPESPWPELTALRAVVERSGRVLAPRLTVYPEYVTRRAEWIDAGLHRAVLHHADAEGFGGRSAWRAGVSTAPPAQPDGAAGEAPAAWAPHAAPVPQRAPERGPGRTARPGRTGHEPLNRLLARASAGDPLTEDGIVRLFAARGRECAEVFAAADQVRRAQAGDTVSYVVNRNINYTNLCTYHCTFCAFAKGRAAAGLRGPGYLLAMEEIARRTAEAGARGATEVCLQGGIHPSFTGETYLEICRTAKAADPGIHVHAFSPLEIRHGADTLGIPVARFLERLKAAGLATLPGTAAEILDDEVRRELCPDKLSTAEWLEIVGTAHEVGFKTTSTIMFGHIETPRNWARHLLALRALQARTGGISEFVPLPFVADEAPLYVKRAARPGPTWREALLMHAVARLVLHPLIPNIQASWVKLGPEGAAAVLRAGVNDLGGTLMNESISRAAGATHGQEFPPERMVALIEGLGRRARQRTTLYGTPPAERVARSFGAAPLAALSTAVPRPGAVRKPARAGTGG